MNDDIEMHENAQALEASDSSQPINAFDIDFQNEHDTIAMLDVLQTCGVAHETAAKVCRLCCQKSTTLLQFAQKNDGRSSIYFLPYGQLSYFYGNLWPWQTG